MANISLSRLNGILLMIVLTGVIMHFGKPFLVPLFFSILLGMLLLPVCNVLESKGISRLWSTLIGVLLILMFFAGIIGIIAAQGTALADDWPKMQQRGEQIIRDVQVYIESQYGIGPSEQSSYVRKGVSRMSETGGKIFGGIWDTLSSFLTGFVLTILYFFFLMWKREKYEEFILKLTDPKNRAEVQKELNLITQVSSQYLAGRLVSMVFLSTVYIIGFSIVGLPNAILISLVAVLPTIVPYIGAFVGGFFPLAMVLVGGTPDMFLPVILILVLAQVFDNNIIEPLAEGESLHIGPIWTIIALVLGEFVWGVAGMILFMPLVAILKIVCDHIPRLHPYAFLLDNELESPALVRYARKLFGGKR